MFLFGFFFPEAHSCTIFLGKEVLTKSEQYHKSEKCLLSEIECIFDGGGVGGNGQLFNYSHAVKILTTLTLNVILLSF